MTDKVSMLMRRCASFQKEAHRVLGVHESSRSRVVHLEETYRGVEALDVRQDELIRQALRCAENELYRAAHVMAWAGFIDFVEEQLSADGLRMVRSARPAWTIQSIEQLRENYPEHQVIEVCHAIGLCSKTEMKALHGLLNKRNECAHPSDFYPNLNETLGYISELLQRIERVKTRALSLYGV